MKASAAAFLSGVIFAVGLALGGMTRTEKVIGFLDVTGAWDPSLTFVMGGALLVHFPLYRLLRRRASPLFEGAFKVPDRRDINLQLIAGAALFGVGWGLGGFCPAPGIVSIATGRSAVLFALSLAGGSWVAGLVERRRAS